MARHGKHYQNRFGPFLDRCRAYLGRQLKKALVYYLSIYMSIMPAFAAGITPDNTGGGNTNLGTPSGANSIPVLNINAPTTGGVSHNKFQDFNVEEKGLIVNNLNMASYNPNYTSALSGEHVEFNYNFRTGDAAKVVLNEVVSNSTSALRGYTEIYGHKADYIVANPNGITCAGCGFINIGRLSMITGSANMAGGAVDSFNISPTGILRVEGVGETHFGLYSPTNADLVSSAVRVAGEIYVDGDLSIYSGNDRFDYKNKVVSSNNNAGVEIAVDATAIGVMKANNIRIHATQKGFGINTSGNLIADLGNMEITADGNIAVKNIAAAKDAKIKSLSGDIHATNGGNIYAQYMDFAAGRDFINDASLEAEEGMCIASDRDFKNNKSILSAKSLEISVGRDFTNATTGDIQSNIDLDIEIGRNAANSGAIYSKNNTSMVAGGNIQNNLGAFIVSNRDLEIAAAGNITNIGKINVARDGFLSALNLHNYGQILANRDLDFNIGNDLINYRAAAILAGGNIFFHIARNLTNYKAEIFAMGDILFEGRDDINPASSSPVLNKALYDNPYIEAEPANPVVNPPAIIPLPEETESAAATQFELDDGTILILPGDAFSEEPATGEQWIDENGYIFIVGEEIFEDIEIDNPDYIACSETETCTDEEPKITQRVYSYTGTEKITIKSNEADEDGYHKNLSYVILEPQDEEDEETPEAPPPEQDIDDIPVQNGTGTASSDSLDDKKVSILAGYEFNDNLMGTLLNWAGRIESGGNLEINAKETMNKGFDINTGNARANIGYDRDFRLCEHLAQSCDWKEVGREYITKINLDSIAAQIIAGGGILINGNNLLNQSGIISSHGDMILNLANSVKNLTYSEVQNLEILEHRSKWKWRGFKSWYRNEYRNKTKQKRIYSKQRSTILSGGDLKIKTTTLQNDQVLEPLSGFNIGTPVPDDVKNTISVNTKLPVGDNGLFKVAPDGKYLVVSNTTFTNPDDFVGSGYFFSNLGNGTTYIDNARIIGDPAYETRLVMDAILKATQQHYLDNDGEIGSDAEQMQALYDAAIDASQTLKLKVGVALTPSQISQLQEDIIWYVEKDINGEKVLVPQIYLSQATLASIDNNKGSKINGINVVAENDYIVNVGTLSAKNLLDIDAIVVNNTSGTMKTTGKDSKLKIKAGELNNITSTQLIFGKSTDHEQIWTEVGNTATISSAGDLSVITTGDMNVVGGKIAAANDANLNIGGDLNVLAAQNYSYERKDDGKAGWFSKEKSINITENIRNQLSEIDVGNNLNIEAGNNVNMIGANVNAYDGKIVAGNEFNLLSAQDYDHTYSYYEKTSIDPLSVIVQSVATAALGIGSIFYPPLAVPAAASAVRTGELIVSDHKKQGKETEKESITQVKSTLNFENKFESYSENNTLIMSSNITAKNPDSQMKTGVDENIVIADLSDTTKTTKATAEYSPMVLVNFKYGSTPEQAWDKEKGDWRPYTPDSIPTPVDEFIKYIANQLSGLGEGIGDAIGGLLGKVIIKNTSDKKIENLILKYPKKWVADNTLEEFNPNLPPETPEPNTLQKFCNKDGCKIDGPNEKSYETKVESVIKLGE